MGLSSTTDLGQTGGVRPSVGRRHEGRIGAAESRHGVEGSAEVSQKLCHVDVRDHTVAIDVDGGEEPTIRARCRLEEAGPQQVVVGQTYEAGLVEVRVASVAVAVAVRILLAAAWPLIGTIRDLDTIVERIGNRVRIDIRDRAAPPATMRDSPSNRNPGIAFGLMIMPSAWKMNREIVSILPRWELVMAWIVDRQNKLRVRLRRPLPFGFP